MRIMIENRQRRFRIDRAALRRVATALAARAAAWRDGPPWCEVTFILVDDAGMAPLNCAIMRHDGPTDVITQRYTPLPCEPDGILGEVFVNVERAWQVGARRRGWPAARELALYLAHGCDHLNDEDDATPAARQRMRRREQRWLSALRVPLLLTPNRRAPL